MTDLKDHLHHYLQIQRTSLRLKLDGLSEYDARLPRTPTGTNLLGLYKHAGACELGYFGETFGRPSELPLPWDRPGVTPEDNTDLFAVEDESMGEVIEWTEACFVHANATISALPLETEGSVPWWPEGTIVTLGRILVHMIQEEARHAGHADILREQIDDAVGWRGAGDNLPDWDPGRWSEYHARLTAIAESRRQGRIGAWT